MKTNLKLCACVLSLIFLFSPGRIFALDEPFDHSRWDQFLSRFVNEEGEVDYKAAKAAPALLTQYLEQLGSISPADFKKNWPREERLALFMNAYNAGCIAAILQHYPVKTIQSIPGIWDLQFIKIAGRGYSLNQIRTQHLLQVFRDEKIHTALACPAKSCPRLIQEAYTGPRVEGQLFLAARRFVNDSRWTQILPEAGKVRISKIYQWYGNDFNLDFGAPADNERGFSPAEYAVLSFIAHYLDDPEKTKFLEEGDFKVKYLDFDWTLNEGPAGGEGK